MIERGEGGRGETEGHESKRRPTNRVAIRKAVQRSQHLAVAQTRNIAIDGDDNSEGVTARERPKIERGWTIKQNGGRK